MTPVWRRFALVRLGGIVPGIRCKMNFAAANAGEHEGSYPLILK
jgi:hypothetical protein